MYDSSAAVEEIDRNINSLEQMNSLVSQVSSGIKEIGDGRATMLKEVGNLKSISSQVRESITEMKSGIGQINTSVTDVSVMSGENKELIEGLVELVSQFTVSEENAGNSKNLGNGPENLGRRSAGGDS